jgi:hypothetical protein
VVVVIKVRTVVVEEEEYTYPPIIHYLLDHIQLLRVVLPEVILVKIQLLLD